MRIWICLALSSVMLLAGCSGNRDSGVVSGSRDTPRQSAETSIGATVPLEDPSLARVDASGSTPDGVLLAYVEALDSSDWETARSLHATARVDSETVARASDETPQPFEDFAIHEVRVVEADKALVRVTYSTQGVSALDNTLKPVVVSEPGEWWVMEKSDGHWKVTSKGPWD